MKPTTNHYLRIIGSIIFIVGTLSIIMSFKTVHTKTNLSGMWLINLSKSEFGDSPNYVLPKKLEIDDQETSIKMKFTWQSETGADSTFLLVFIPGQVTDNMTAERRTQHFHVTRTDNDQSLKIEYSSSFTDEPDNEEYHTVQYLQLSPDRKELTFKKDVKVNDGYAYTVNGSYDKQ